MVALEGPDLRRMPQVSTLTPPPLFAFSHPSPPFTAQYIPQTSFPVLTLCVPINPYTPGPYVRVPCPFLSPPPTSFVHVIPHNCLGHPRPHPYLSTGLSTSIYDCLHVSIPSGGSHFLFLPFSSDPPHSHFPRSPLTKSSIFGGIKSTSGWFMESRMVLEP
jgi:hypothetical protein